VAYPVVNAIHIAAIGALLASVLLMDFSILGAISSVPREKLVALLRRVALTSFAVAVLSGLTLFAVRATHYAETPVFLIKMGVIGLAILNFIAFTALDRKSHPEATSFALRLCAITSILLWSSVLLAGRFIGFV
jgi:hypothetical protein